MNIKDILNLKVKYFFDEATPYASVDIKGEILSGKMLFFKDQNKGASLNY